MEDDSVKRIFNLMLYITRVILRNPINISCNDQSI